MSGPDRADGADRPGGGPRVPAAIGLANEALRFVLELCLVGVAGWWGWHAGSSLVERLVLVVLLPLAVCLVWALAGAPKARYATRPWVPVALIYVLALVAAWALADLGHPALGAVLVVLVVLNDVALHLGVRSISRTMPRR